MSKPKTIRERAEAAVSGTVPPGTSAFRERVDLYMRAYRAGRRKGPTEKQLLAEMVRLPRDVTATRVELAAVFAVIRSCFARAK